VSGRVKGSFQHNCFVQFGEGKLEFVPKQGTEVSESTFVYVKRKREMFYSVPKLPFVYIQYMILRVERGNTQNKNSYFIFATILFQFATPSLIPPKCNSFFVDDAASATAAVRTASKSFA
jgi:hypothetical protein